MPILSFAVRHLQADAGVVITASHNPPQYNGYKVYGPDGAQIGPETADEVTRAINALKYTDAKTMPREQAEAPGFCRCIGNLEVDDEYIRRVKTLSIHPDIVQKEGKNLKIVYTPLHGSGNVPVRRILKEIGITGVSVVKEQELPDPAFPTVKAAKPRRPRRVYAGDQAGRRGGRGRVLRHRPGLRPAGRGRAREGRAFPPAHRQPDRLPDALLHPVHQAGRIWPQTRAVVKSIVSTQLAKPICDAYGVALFDTLTGFKFIGEMIQQFEDERSHHFLFGFEESYGYLSSTFVRDKDGVNASLLIAEAAAYYKMQGKTLSDVMEEIFKTYGYYLEHVESASMPGSGRREEDERDHGRRARKPAQSDRRREGGRGARFPEGRQGERRRNRGEARLFPKRRAVLQPRSPAGSYASAPAAPSPRSSSTST